MPRISLHELRHSYASISQRLGTPLTTTSRALGHSTIFLTGDVYSHSVLDDFIAAAGRLNAAFVGAVSAGSLRSRGCSIYARNDIFMTGSMGQPVWLYSTLDDLRASSAEVRDAMGGAIRAAQFGEMSADAEPMKGDLREVVEIRAHDRDGIYRLMYTTKIGDILIVLDFFKKKGVSGGATAKVDLDRIRQRYQKAKEQYGKKGR